MKSFFSLLGRYALTLIAVAVAACVAFIFWKQYAQTPWTRDGTGFGQMWCRLRRMFPGR